MFIGFNEPILGEKLSSLLGESFSSICFLMNLFVAGDHVRTISVAAPTSMGGLMKFAVRTATCLGCKTPLPKDGTLSAICFHILTKLRNRCMYQLPSQDGRPIPKALE